MNLLQKFQQHLREENLFSRGDSLLLAVSGGVDSTVMAHLCRASGFRIAFAHCNFRLRGQDSDADEEFVKSLAAAWKVPCHTRSFDTAQFSADNKMGIQEAARHLRYGWFDSLISGAAGEGEFDFLLTAHQADDNIETLMMNFFKGTGINGLSGIRPRSEKIIRPLLFAFREEIMQYAMENGVAYREDASNRESYYTRNYFRNELIPSIEKVFPQVRHNLDGNIRRFNDIATVYREAMDGAKKKLIDNRGHEAHIPVGKLRKMKALHSVVYEIIRDYGFGAGQVDEVMALLDSETGRHISSATHIILKNRGWLIISPLSEPASGHHLIGPDERRILFANHSLNIDKSGSLQKIVPDNKLVQLDARDIRFPLLLRRWRQGDYFYPLGMRKKKKLSRFLIDQKVPLIQKKDVWVLESEGRILWVLGYRIDERFKITDSTRSILRLEFQ